MSCSVCAGYSSYNCPCCSEEVQMIPCPDCSDGYEYFAFNVHTGQQVKVTLSAYMILPYDEDDARAGGQNYYQGPIIGCRTCKGEREIPRHY